jgi:hypothetical protein
MLRAVGWIAVLLVLLLIGCEGVKGEDLKKRESKYVKPDYSVYHTKYVDRLVGWLNHKVHRIFFVFSIFIESILLTFKSQRNWKDDLLQFPLL